MNKFTKFIFLDIDGVLVTRKSLRLPLRQWRGFPHHIFELSCVDALNSLLNTGASIVVSSTWRLGIGLTDLRGLLLNEGVALPVLDCTPRLPGEARGKEITAWLQEYRQYRGDIENFVILDDDSDFGEILRPRHIKTNMESGLTRFLANFAHCLLTTPPKGKVPW